MKLKFKPNSKLQWKKHERANSFGIRDIKALLFFPLLGNKSKKVHSKPARRSFLFLQSMLAAFRVSPMVQLLVCCVIMATIFNKQLVAAFTHQELTLFVEIDGKEFGAFDHIRGFHSSDDEILSGNNINMKAGDKLKNNADQSLESDAVLSFLENEKLNHKDLIVSLSRQFIAERSLYSWASQYSKTYSKPRDVHLLLKTSEGKVVDHYALKLAFPISWSLKVQENIAGGYHEVINFSMLEISRQK